jgi:hypothetical protein
MLELGALVPPLVGLTVRQGLKMLVWMLWPNTGRNLSQ